MKAAGAAGIAGLAGCAGNGGEQEATTTEQGGDATTTTGEQARTLKMGMLMAVTGDLGTYGAHIRQGAELPVNQINDADVPFTVDTQFEDTATDPNQGISGAEAMVNAGYPMIVGALSSGVTIQVAKNVLSQSGIVGTSPSSTSPVLTGLQDNDFLFRTVPHDALQGAVMAQIVAERFEAMSASTLYVNNDYGQGLSEAFTKSFESDYGGTVHTQVATAKEQSSYTSKLQTALEGQPEALVMITYPASGTQMFKDFYSDFDSDAQILVSDGLKDPQLPSKVGAELSNVRGTAPIAEGPGTDYFNSQYESAFGAQPQIYDGQAYDAAAVMLLANAAAGENDGAAIRDNMRAVANPEGTVVTPEQLPEGLEMVANGEDIDFRGASSAVDFDDAGDMKAVTYDYFEFTSDGLETVEKIQFKK